jgi:hypothetical protein
MKELLLNTLSSVDYKIYVDGVATAPTGNVTVSVSRAGAVVVDSQTATSTGAGAYKYILPIEATIDGETVGVLTDEGILDVTWEFTLSGQDFSITEQYDVVTPYSPWSYFEAEGVEYADYLECEKIARYVINSHCGQEFGREYTTYGVEGKGTNTLLLPRHLQTLESVTWVGSGFPVRPGTVIGFDDTYVWEVAGDGWALRQQPYPKISVVHKSRDRFQRNTIYNVKGVWGYPSVPGEVEEASKIIIADYLCVEHKYRDKYLENLKMGDWSMSFSDKVWAGTGNATADALLVDYTLSPGIGLI